MDAGTMAAAGGEALLSSKLVNDCRVLQRALQNRAAAVPPPAKRLRGNEYLTAVAEAQRSRTWLLTAIQQGASALEEATSAAAVTATVRQLTGEHPDGALSDAKDGEDSDSVVVETADPRFFRAPEQRWTVDEDTLLKKMVESMESKPGMWKVISDAFNNKRSETQCLHRWTKVLRPGLVKGPWRSEEDELLKQRVTAQLQSQGHIKWSVVAKALPGRLGKQCRERWQNHLDPAINKGDWTPEEDRQLAQLQQKLGNRWSDIARHLPGRSENAVKNRVKTAAHKNVVWG